MKKIQMGKLYYVTKLEKKKVKNFIFLLVSKLLFISDVCICVGNINNNLIGKQKSKNRKDVQRDSLRLSFSFDSFW